jgi:hypothetical protein
MSDAGESLQGSARPKAPGNDHAEGAGDARDAASLSVAVELADQALCGASLPRDAYASLLSDLYEGVRMRMPYRELLHFARATVSRAQVGAVRADRRAAG